MKFKQHQKSGSVLYALVVAIVMFVVVQAQAVADNVTDAELAMLPPYCEVKMRSKDPAVIESWDRQFGHHNWIHMHHYCGGLADVSRAERGNDYDKKRFLRNAIFQFDYMLANTQPDFFMRPDFHHNKGMALRLQNNEGAAVAEFHTALEIKADFIPALTELVKVYTKMGKNDMALSVLRRGLEKSPNMARLRKKYQELGGDLSEFPEITVHQPTESSDQALTSFDQTDKAAMPVISPNSPAEAVPRADETGDEPVKIGIPGNPWCRFCPDQAPAPGENQ